MTDPPSLSTCAPNAIAAVSENVRWMSTQRYEVRQLIAAREEAATSQKPSALVSFLSKRAELLYPQNSRRPVAERLDGQGARGGTNTGMKKTPATGEGSPDYELDNIIRRTLADLANRVTDSSGKSPCRFFFGESLTGRTCDRRSSVCSRSHDAEFWHKHGISVKSVATAVTANRSSLVVDNDSSRSNGRRETQHAPRESSWRVGHRRYDDHRQSDDDRYRRDRSRSRARTDGDSGSRDQIAGNSHTQRTTDSERGNSSSKTVSREGSSRTDGGADGDDRSRDRSSNSE